MRCMFDLVADAPEGKLAVPQQLGLVGSGRGAVTLGEDVVHLLRFVGVERDSSGVNIAFLLRVTRRLLRPPNMK